MPSPDGEKEMMMHAGSLSSSLALLLHMTLPTPSPYPSPHSLLVSPTHMAAASSLLPKSTTQTF
jgi:hypothetical protein